MNATLCGPVFVVFEGLDGSGKTTCGRKVAARLGATFLATPSGSIREHRSNILSDFEGSQEAAQHLFLASVFDVSKRVGGFLSRGESVVLDRYFLSTEVYAAFRGSRVRHDDQCHLLVPADLTVFLHAPWEVRRARAISRGQITVADLETLDAEAESGLWKEYRARESLPVVGRSIAIDTSRLTENETVERVLEAIVG